MKKIKKWFTHNPWLKLLSLALAGIIWLVVINTSNPRVSANINVNYDVLNEKEIESDNQVYFTNTSSVTVTFNVRMKYKGMINSDAFSAYINMEDYTGDGEIPVYIEIDSAVSDLISDVTVNPAKIQVRTEKIQQKKFTIERKIEGEPAEGYRAGDLSVTPEYIYVKGPVSVIGKISSAGISVDAQGTTKELNGITSVAFYDANGNVLSGIEENLSFAGDISYKLPVYRIKSLTVNAFPGGAPATGFAVDSVETSPTFISVYGPEEVLNEFSYIVIPGSDLNVSGKKDPITFNLDTKKYIPEGLELATQTPEITVYVKFRNIFDTKDQTGAAAPQPAAVHSEPAKPAETHVAETVTEPVPETESSISEEEESDEEFEEETEEEEEPEEYEEDTLPAAE